MNTWHRLLIIGFLLCCSGCFSSKTTGRNTLQTIRLETLTVENLTEELTKNDEIEIHVFLINKSGNVLVDKLITQEFTKVPQTHSLSLKIAASAVSGRLFIALIEQDSEISLSTTHHQTLLKTFRNLRWENTPSTLSELSKQFGDDDLMDVQVINLTPNKSLKSYPKSLEFSGIHLFDSFKYLMRLSYVE